MGKRASREMIEKLTDFKRRLGVERMILFGSHARGKADENSDVDLILVSKKFRGIKPYKRSSGMWLRWNLDLPVDFICLTDKEFENQKKQVSIVSEALREGIQI